MSTRSQLTKDLNDSVTALLGKRIKILLKNVVKLETKGDKTENRVLVFSPCRLFLLTAKVPTRIDCHFHYLEIKGIEARKENTISFLIGEKWYTFICQNGEVESMLHALSAALQVIFPGVALQEMMSRVSLDGLDWEEILPEPSGVPPCGGFSTQYACMCDYHGLTYRDEVAWDVDTIYVSHNTRELNLKDFEHLEPKDMVPIISALEHNRWFTGFKAANIKLTHEAFDRILHVFSRSITLESLTLHNLSLRPDAINRLSSAIVSNPNTPLNSLDLSNNPAIEDKGVNSLCAILTKLVQDGKGVSKLNLSNIGLGGKGVAQLTQCLATLRPSTLVYLNLSGAVIKDELNGLLNLLAEPNAITHLDVSNTDIVLDTVFGALLRGCSTSLVHLNLSKNSFSVKKSKEMPPSFKQFFTSTLALKYLNMSHCKLPLEALKNLLLGLACNESTAGLKLDISSNCLGSQGAHVLESCIHGVRSVSSLDISDNGLESELGGVVAAVGKNKSITELMLCRNLAGLKAKHLAPVVDSIIHTIQEDDCPIQSLSLADCKLKSELHPIINALGSNQCLTSLDISGNGMGDLGARLLSKALQTNCKLKSVIFDRNNITFQGLSDIAYAMQSNYSVTYVGCLLHDVIPSMKLSPDKTEQALSAIYRALYRNSDPSNTKVLRRQHVFARLQDIAEGGDLNSPIQHKLSSASQEVAVILQKHVAGRVDEMISTAEELCGSRVMSDRLKAELKASVAPRLSLDQDFLSSVVVTQPATQITLKASEMGLTAATHLAEKITDEVVDLLNKTQTSLLGGKRSSTPDVLRMMPRQLPDPLHPLATPQLINRRKSLHSRKLRPTSAVDTVSAEHIPDLLPSISNSPQDSLDSVCEGAGQRLQHLVKGRPKRLKTRAPSRPTHPGAFPDSEDFDSTDNQSTASEMSSSMTKTRPWSTIDKSDICSEGSTAANTPDSPDTPSILSDGDKKSVRDIAAGLNKQEVESKVG